MARHLCLPLLLVLVGLLAMTAAKPLKKGKGPIVDSVIKRDHKSTEVVEQDEGEMRVPAGMTCFQFAFLYVSGSVAYPVMVYITLLKPRN